MNPVICIRGGLWLLVSIVSAAGVARASEFDVSEQQRERLGIELAAPQPVDHIKLASAPAEVVVPPAREAVVSAPIDGLVARLLVAEGEPVERGTLIAELESPALLEWQRTFLDAALEQALAAAQLERDRTLHGAGIIAARRLEETTARERAAASRLEQARRQLELAGQSDTELVTLTRTQRLTSRLELKAPFDGVVTERLTQVGARLAAREPVVRLANLSELWVELRLRPEIAARVEPGMQVLLTPAGTHIRAPITTVGGHVDAATQTVLVRAAIDNADGRLRAGQFLGAEILAPVAERHAYSVPVAAVTQSGADSYVFVATERGFDPRRIEAAGADTEHVYIIAGPIDGSTLVAVAGISTLKSLWLASLEGS